MHARKDKNKNKKCAREYWYIIIHHRKFQQLLSDFCYT